MIPNETPAVSLTAVKVISMKSAADRRLRFTENAAEARLAWDFYTAASGIIPGLSYDEARARRRFGRALRPGELGCYSSHFGVWKWLIESGVPQAIVLEDDVAVDWAVLNRLAAQNMANSDIHLLRLFSTHPFRSEVVRYKLLSDHTHLLRLKGLFFGTQAYLITRRGAIALVEAGRRVDAPVDWLMSRYWEFGFPSYVMFPFPLFERMVPSMIESRENAERRQPLRYRVPRFMWRLHDKIGQHWYETARRRRDRFGSVSDSSDVGVLFRE